jgi:flagellar biosynthesis protein FlhA
MEYHEMLLRFVGRLVCVSTFGHIKLWGKLAAVTDDCLRLVNTSLSGESEDPWLAQHQFEDGERSANRLAETLVHFHHVVAISCLDDDLPAINFNNEPPAQNAAPKNLPAAEQTEESSSSAREEDPQQYSHGDRLEMRIGANLIALADAKRGGDLSDRINHLRNLIGKQLGIVLPPVRIRDDSRYDADEYRIFVHGAEIARGKIRTGKLLAISGPSTKAVVEGERTIEPAFGQPAVWIEPEQRPSVEKQGYFAVEASTVLVTHLQKVVRRQAADLFSLDALRQMLEYTRRYAPTAVEEVVPNRISLPRLHELLTRLLEEEVPLRPFELILERIAQLDHQNSSFADLLIDLRATLGRQICERHRDAAGQLNVFTLDRTLHDQVALLLLEDPVPESGEWVARFVDELRSWYQEQRELEARELPLVVDSVLRRKLWSLVNQAIPGLTVIAYSEVAHDLPVKLVASLTKRMLHLEERPARKPSRGRKLIATKAAKPERSSTGASKPSQPR